MLQMFCTIFFLDTYLHTCEHKGFLRMQAISIYHSGVFDWWVLYGEFKLFTALV